LEPILGYYNTESALLKPKPGGWGFSSVVERLPRKRKALGSVPSSKKKRTKKKKKKKEKKKKQSLDQSINASQLQKKIKFKDRERLKLMGKRDKQIWRTDTTYSPSASTGSLCRPESGT